MKFAHNVQQNIAPHCSLTCISDSQGGPPGISCGPERVP